MKSLKSGKAAGICGIAPEMLKAGGPRMIEALRIVFNIVWRTEVVPSDWKKAVIIPIYKNKGSKRD